MSDEGIILAECLISFLVLSSYLLLFSAIMVRVYSLKQDIFEASNNVIDLKSCMLYECALSSGNSVYEKCINIAIKGESKEVCIEI